jgi:putative two-component system response regulator
MTTDALPTLLLIADHPQLVYLIRRYAEQSGCQVISDGRLDTALELARRERPAMVLLYLMPDVYDDWSSLRRLRRALAPYGIPITIISAIADEARARDEGAAGWLWQPVMFADFRAVLTHAGILPDNAASGYTLIYGATGSHNAR